MSSTESPEEIEVFTYFLVYGALLHFSLFIVYFTITIAILYFFFKTIIRAFQIFYKIKKDKNPTLWWTFLVLLVLNLTVIGNGFFGFPFIFLVYLVYFHPQSLKIQGNKK